MSGKGQRGGRRENTQDPKALPSIWGDVDADLLLKDSLGQSEVGRLSVGSAVGRIAALLGWSERSCLQVDGLDCAVWGCDSAERVSKFRGHFWIQEYIPDEPPEEGKTGCKSGLESGLASGWP